MKKILLSVLLVITTVVAGTAPAYAAGKSPVLDRILERGEIRVGMSGAQPPYTVKAKGGTLIGFEVELAEILAGSMGVKFKPVVKPFGQLLKALEDGEVDMVMSGMTITPKRNTRAFFVGPYMISGKSILTKSKTLAAIDEAEDINEEDIKLAVMGGSTSADFVELLMPKAQLTRTGNYDDAVKLLIDDKVDAVVADMEICLISVLRYPDMDLATLSEPLTIEPIGVALPAEDPLLVNLVQNYIDALESVDLLEELRARWFDDGTWLIQLP